MEAGNKGGATTGQISPALLELQRGSRAVRLLSAFFVDLARVPVGFQQWFEEARCGQCYVCHIVEVMREVKRVLRDDGTVWLNLGDCYATGGGRVGDAPGGGKQGEAWRIRGLMTTPNRMPIPGLKPKDLCMIPARVALALQADGWWIRCDAVWNKLNPMPESVSGWRWEQHRVKIGRKNVEWKERPKGWQPGEGAHHDEPAQGNYRGAPDPTVAEWADCPGCPTCELNGGLVLRRGAWRPTRAHEYLFLLAKSPDYYCDGEAVKEPQDDDERRRRLKERESGLRTRYELKRDGEAIGQHPHSKDGVVQSVEARQRLAVLGTRNLRSVWSMATEPYAEAHFATFPRKLVEPCILAGTSARGACAKCGAPWARIIQRDVLPPPDRIHNNPFKHDTMTTHGEGGATLRNVVSKETAGWRPTCSCSAPVVPCIVLDHFVGSGTTVAVAESLGRRGIGLELKPEYIDLARKRIAAVMRGLPIF
jgi:hypothetical protein